MSIKTLPIEEWTTYKQPGAYDALDDSIQCTWVNPDPDTRADQSGKDDADINVIVKRFLGGQQLMGPPQLPTFEDYSEVTDYQSMMNLVRQAAEEFNELPANLRRRFDNDPGKLESFIADPANRTEAESLGLVDKKPPPEGSNAPTGAPNQPQATTPPQNPSAAPKASNEAASHKADPAPAQ